MQEGRQEVIGANKMSPKGVSMDDPKLMDIPGVNLCP